MSEQEVDHPSHYNTGKIETISYIEDQNLGFHLGNCIKYISRAGKKSPTTVLNDLEKAQWYLERYIDAVRNELPIKENTGDKHVGQGRINEPSGDIN